MFFMCFFYLFLEAAEPVVRQSQGHCAAAEWFLHISMATGADALQEETWGGQLDVEHRRDPREAEPAELFHGTRRGYRKFTAG